MKFKTWPPSHYKAYQRCPPYLPWPLWKYGTTWFRGQKYFNIAFVLQDEWLTNFTRLANTCTCPLKAYAIKSIRESNVIWFPRVILPKALILFGENYSSFLDFACNYERTSGIFVPWLIYPVMGWWPCINLLSPKSRNLSSAAVEIGHFRIN